MVDAISGTADVAATGRTVSKLVALPLAVNKTLNPLGEAFTHAIGNKLQTQRALEQFRVTSATEVEVDNVPWGNSQRMAFEQFYNIACSDFARFDYG